MINKQLYSYYGHTYLGLKNIYKTKMTLREYNDIIYEPTFIESLMSIKPNSVTIQTKKQTELLLMNAMTKILNPILFKRPLYLA